MIPECRQDSDLLGFVLNVLELGILHIGIGLRYARWFLCTGRWFSVLVPPRPDQYKKHAVEEPSHQEGKKQDEEKS